MRLSATHKRVLGRVWLVAVALGIGWLVWRIVTRAPYVPQVHRVASGCETHPLALIDKTRLHHTLEPCARYEERAMRVDGGTTDLEYRIDVEINSLGFRNREYDPVKPKGSRRIVLLGDSFTYGFGLPLEETFFKLLERSLSARRGAPVEVWNIAVGSWGTAIHERIAESSLRSFEPDMVILMFDDSDLYDNAAYRDEADAKGKFSPDGNTEPFWRRRTEYIARALAFGEPEQARALIDELHTLTAKHILSIARHVKSIQVPFLMVTYPYPNFPEDYESLQLAKLYGLVEPEGVRILSLYPDFPKARKKSEYFQKNRHWNAAGSRRVAVRLESYIAEHHAALLEP